MLKLCKIIQLYFIRVCSTIYGNTVKSLCVMSRWRPIDLRKLYCQFLTKLADQGKPVVGYKGPRARLKNLLTIWISPLLDLI